MTKLQFVSAAETDFTEALCWYSERSQQAAEDFQYEFEKALSKIVADPYRFPACDQNHQYYLMQRFPFQIIYRNDQNTVTIIAVAHCKRQPGYWSKR